jgi:hypothetical protein
MEQTIISHKNLVEKPKRKESLADLGADAEVIIMDRKEMGW